MRTPPHSRDSGDCAAEVVGERPPSGGRGSATGRMPEGGRAERRERAEPEDEKKGPLESRRRGAERNEEQTAPVPAGRWPTARSGGPMGAATGNRDGLNRNLYEEICLLCVACGEKMRGRACRVGGAKPAAGVCVPKGAVARWTSRASACRRTPPAEWKSRSAAEGCRNDRDDTPL